MPRNSGGTYVPPAGSWNPAVNAANATLDDWNALLTDMTNALTTSIATNGVSVVSASIPMAAHKLTGLAAGSTNGDSVRYEQVVGAFQPIAAILTALAALSWSSGNQFPYFTAASTISLGTVSANGLTLLGHTFAQMLSDLAAMGTAGGTFTGEVILPSTGPISTLSAGFRAAPNTGTPNSAYGLLLADAGGTLYHDEVTARTWTIPANASVAYPIGTVIVIDNTGNSGSAGTLTLSITSDTLRRGDGTAGTGSRTISAGQVAAIRKTKSTEWVITGGFT